MTFPILKETLKQTTSLCPTCQAAVPAEVWKTTGTPAKVYLTRTCAEHGEATACIASDARFSWLAKGAHRMPAGRLARVLPIRQESAEHSAVMPQQKCRKWKFSPPASR